MKNAVEIAKKFWLGEELTPEENEVIVGVAKCCNELPYCDESCPFYFEHRESAGFTLNNCTSFFAKYIAKEKAKSDRESLNELANNCIKICNEIKIKTKRETPMQVVVSHSNGKTIYHCYNCGKPLFIQPSTQYCECCGQKLSFEVVENEI